MLRRGVSMRCGLLPRRQARAEDRLYAPLVVCAGLLHPPFHLLSHQSLLMVVTSVRTLLHGAFKAGADSAVLAVVFTPRVCTCRNHQSWRLSAVLL